MTLSTGFLAIVHLDGQPIDTSLFNLATNTLEFRNPTPVTNRVNDYIGMSNVLTTLHDIQQSIPSDLVSKFTNDIWITGDIRIDDKENLRRKLHNVGLPDVLPNNDAHLLLCAYLVWDTAFIEHVIGDFSFVIWDFTKKRLFAARDHFGIRPFYYVHVKNTLIISNTIDSLRAFPTVTTSINDLAVADYLIFGFNQQLDTTTFKDIKRLPPAHTLLADANGHRTTRYWSLPTDGYIRYADNQQYIDHLQSLMTQAVGDRLTDSNTAILMSGGLDSSSVAAVAMSIVDEKNLDSAVTAYTAVYDELIPDQERHFSTLVARYLGIPIFHKAVDSYDLYQRRDTPQQLYPEPFDELADAQRLDLFHRIHQQHNTALTGLGGDPLFAPSPFYFLGLLRSFQLRQFFKEVFGYALASQRLPRIGLRTKLFNRDRRDVWQPAFPAWINRSFERKHNLRARWEDITANPIARAEHPLRPEAYHSLSAPFWVRLFEVYDANYTRLPLTIIHPFFDIRLVEYMLSIPALPWCNGKKLLRLAMRDKLPDEILNRPKTPLAGDIVKILLKKQLAESRWQKHMNWTTTVNQYVSVDVLDTMTNTTTIEELDWTLITRPVSLNYWLTTQGL